MVLREAALGWISAWELGDESPTEETEAFYETAQPPRRMDASVCCLPGSGAQHPSHPVNLPSAVQSQSLQSQYQYADQIVPERGQNDAMTVLAATQDNWQQISSANAAAAVTAAATTTAYIDYSWLQMQVMSSFPAARFCRGTSSGYDWKFD